MSTRRHKRLFTLLCWLQGAYYFATGLWPLVSMRSFIWITGEKTDNLPSGLDFDHWLVAAVAGLILAVAACLLTAASRKSHDLEVAVLALGAALALTAIDVIYTVRGVISPIYLADAVLELPLIITWSGLLIAMRRAPATSGRTNDYVSLSGKGAPAPR